MENRDTGPVIVFSFDNLLERWKRSVMLALGEELEHKVRNSAIAGYYDYLLITGKSDGDQLTYTITLGVGTPPEQTNG